MRSGGSGSAAGHGTDHVASATVGAGVRVVRDASRALHLLVHPDALMNERSQATARAVLADAGRVRPLGQPGSVAALSVAWRLGYHDVLPIVPAAPGTAAERLAVEWAAPRRPSGDDAPEQREPVLWRALRIHEHQHCAPCAHDLARVVRCSERTLRRLAIAVFGMSIGDVLAARRAELRDHLLVSGASLRDVAELIGYSSTAALSRAIKLTTGHAAGEWRTKLWQRRFDASRQGQVVSGRGLSVPSEATPSGPASPAQPDSPAR